MRALYASHNGVVVINTSRSWSTKSQCVFRFEQKNNNNNIITRRNNNKYIIHKTNSTLINDFFFCSRPSRFFYSRHTHICILPTAARASPRVV